MLANTRDTHGMTDVITTAEKTCHWSYRCFGKGCNINQKLHSKRLQWKIKYRENKYFLDVER